MKKVLLTMCAGAMSLIAAASPESIDFSLAFKVNEALTYGPDYVGYDIWQAIYFSPELADLYAGGKVTSINVTTGENIKAGKNGISRVTAYLMEDLESEAFRTQTGRLGLDAYAQNKIALDDPYTIEAGKGFYVAYKCAPSSTDDYYIAVDGVPRMQEGGCYIGITQKGVTHWANYAEDFGNLNLGITIESDNLPQNAASLFNADYPAVVYPGQPFDINVNVMGSAINDINSLEIQCKIADENPVSQSFELSEPMSYGTYATLKLTNVVTSAVGANMPITFTVTKVNGVENASADASRGMTITSLGEDMGYFRKSVVEEGTGTWCQYCPAGIVMMEFLKNEYSDMFIRVAVHGGNDPMTVSSTNPVLSFFSGFPMAMVDRKEKFVPNINSESFFDRYAVEWGSVPAIAEVSQISPEIDTDATQVNVKTTVHFAVPTANDHRYRIAYYITEDGLGPYVQTNGYSGGDHGPMAGWEDEGGSVPVIYDDVAREYAGGTDGFDVFPAMIESGKDYTFSHTLSLENVKGKTFFVTAMIIDTADGSILNANQVVAGEGSGLVEVGDNDGIKVKGSEGSIRISGNYASAIVYDLQGAKVAVANGEPYIALAPGLYIVTIEGKGRKVLVK